MKKALLVIVFIIFAVLILPGIVQPPVESETARGSEVAQLSRALIAALLNYRKEYGQFPTGEAGEIMAALLGKNEKATVFIEPPPMSMNDLGELLDPWGTPFRITFDKVSGMPKIHSAGPNRKFEDKPSKHSDDYYSWHDSAVAPLPLPD